MSAPAPPPNPNLVFPPPLEFIYQRLGNTDYPVEVYLPTSPSAVKSPVIPALIYFHGGGLVMGNRHINTWFPKWLAADALKAGMAVISPSYTFLSPHSGLDVLEDIKSCFSWISNSLNSELLTSGTRLQVDTSRLAVSGSSAGGWCAYMAGSSALPKPRAIISIYGMAGDLLSPMYLEPKTKPFFWLTPFMLNDEDFIPYLNTPSTTRLISTSLDSPRLDYYTWLQQKALFIDVLTGIPGLNAKLLSLPSYSRPSAIPDSVKAMFPNLNITSSFPPTFFIHGTDDEAVPIEESRTMLEACFQANIEGCKMLEVPGGNHDFDYEKESKDVEGLEEVLPWLIEKLK
ncbi:hypothetical protein P7C70_g125, partial [Phenoliferia sp. Uapishka_3]